MNDFEICKEEYKAARELYWEDRAAMNWAFLCWESRWPKELRDKVKQALSW